MIPDEMSYTPQPMPQFETIYDCIRFLAEQELLTGLQVFTLLELLKKELDEKK